MDDKKGILLLIDVLRVRAVLFKVKVGVGLLPKGTESARSDCDCVKKGLTRLNVYLMIVNVGYGEYYLRLLNECGDPLDCCLIRVDVDTDVWVIRREKRRYVDALGLFFVSVIAFIEAASRCCWCCWWVVCIVYCV